MCKHQLKGFSNLNLKTESLILIANYIIAFSCFTINEMSFSPNCSSLGEAAWLDAESQSTSGKSIDTQGQCSPTCTFLGVKGLLK